MNEMMRTNKGDNQPFFYKEGFLRNIKQLTLYQQVVCDHKTIHKHVCLLLNQGQS